MAIKPAKNRTFPRKGAGIPSTLKCIIIPAAGYGTGVCRPAYYPCFIRGRAPYNWIAAVKACKQNSGQACEHTPHLNIQI